MSKNKKRVLNAIKATEKWLNENYTKESKMYSETGGLTIIGCEIRNLKEYREIMECPDLRKLKGRLKELYFAID